jgi:hypothetical protein
VGHRGVVGAGMNEPAKVRPSRLCGSTPDPPYEKDTGSMTESKSHSGRDSALATLALVVRGGRVRPGAGRGSPSGCRGFGRGEDRGPGGPLPAGAKTRPGNYGGSGPHRAFRAQRLGWGTGHSGSHAACRSRGDAGPLPGGHRMADPDIVRVPGRVHFASSRANGQIFS